MSLLAAGCGIFGGGGDDDDDGGDRDAQEQLLSAMVLTEDDLPDGLASTGQSFTTNEEAAPNDPAEVTRLDTWGRQLGLGVDFVLDAQATGPQTFLGVHSDASLYQDAQGCSRSYDYDVDQAKETDWEQSALPGATDIAVTEMDASQIGEEAYWLRISGVSSDGENLLVIDQVIIREGRVRAFLRADSLFLPDAPRNSGEGQVLFWAQTMSSRIEAALAGATPAPSAS